MTGKRIDAMFLRLFFNAYLIFTTVIATKAINTSMDTGNCSDQVDYFLPLHIEPVHYDITLTLRDNTFNGESRIFIKILEHVTAISLHAEDLQIEFNTVLLSKRLRRKQKGLKKGRKPLSFAYCKETQILVLEFGQYIDPGQYDLSMKFVGSLLGPKGFVAINSKLDKGEARQSYVTLFEPTGARSAFPCWDDPRWASTFNVSIEHLETLRAWSNTPVSRKSLTVYETVKTNFKLSPYIPVQYLAIAIIDVESVYLYYEDPIQSNISFWCPPNTRNLLKLTEGVAPMIDYFIAKNMHFTCKGSDINFIVFPNLPTNFLGTWGITIVRQEYIIDKGISVGHQIETQRRVAHIIIRHYIETFSSVVRWFVDWFRKGLALYLSYDIIAESHLHTKMRDLFVVQVVQPVLRNDITLKVPRVIDKYNPIYSSFISNKASVIINMLKHTITKEAFNEGIVDYLKLNYSVSPKDLWHYLEYKVSTKIYLSFLEDLISNWVSQPQYPILYLAEHEDGRGKYITRNYYVTETTDKFTAWMVPLTYTTQTELNFTSTLPKMFFKGNDIDIEGLDPNDWIIFNIQQTGFYRVNYDSDNWLKLARYLNEKDHTKIHHLNRAQIIDDAYHFMMTQEMKHEIFRYLINYLGKEQEYIPWHSMTNILHYTSPFFNFPESQSFKDYILKILTRYLTNQEHTKSKVITTRLLVLHWACKFGDYKSRETAKNNLIYHLMHVKHNLLRAGWKDWTYCAGLITADSTIWSLVATNLYAQDKKATVKYLTCTENGIVVHDFLNSITSEIGDIWIQWELEHLVALYHGIMKKHARREDVFDFVLTNLEKILPGFLNMNEKFGSIIMNVYSECQLSEILVFANRNYSGNLKILYEVSIMIKHRKRQLQRQRDMFLGPFVVTQYKDTCKSIE